MEQEKKNRRPRIGEGSGASRDGNTNKYEKVDYSKRESNSDERRPVRNFNSSEDNSFDRGSDFRGVNRDNPIPRPINRFENSNKEDRPSEGGYQRREGGYQQREGGYQRREGGYQPREGGYQRREGGYQPREGGYQRREGGYQLREGGYQPREGGFQPREGGYQRREGGFQPREGGYQRREGGYQPREGGYQPREGGYQRREGGFQPREGGFQPREGGYQRREGGYQRREGGFQPREGGQQRREGGYQRREGGYQQRDNRGGGGFRKPQQRSGDYDPSAKYSLKKRMEYKDTLTDPNEPIRLNKYLANAGVCSRREADEFIQKGQVKVNNEVVTELGTKIHRNDQVIFNEKAVSLEQKVYVLLNKPKDCVTTADDPQGRLTVMDIVRSAATERIYPVGRLDRNTTGVLLLTNDGDLASKLTHPKFVKKKIYHVWLDKNISEEDMQKVADGVELEDGLIHADAISYANDMDKNQVGIEIHSGRNRIVRRIFEHIGYRVMRLDRVYFAGLTKKNVPRGRWRYLTQQEVNMLRMGAFE